MDYLNSITNHNKNKHLQARHRAVIELRLKDGHSAYKIAKELGRDVNTVRNEIKRGTVKQIRQGIIVKAYFADSAQRVYDNNRKNSVRKYKRLAVSEFIDYVTENIRKRQWSVDVCVGQVTINNRFKRSETVCTRTIYNYIDLGLMAIKNADLPQKLRRNTKIARVRKNKRVLGRSITEIHEEINNRQEFGHWEIDTVIGIKSKEDSALPTLAERHSRNIIVRQIDSKTVDAVISALKKLQE